jgi:hypothetical protein
VVDISMCGNSKHCPLAHNCYRATESGTQPSEWRQSWMMFKWTVKDDDTPGCYNFIAAREPEKTDEDALSNDA